MEEHRQANDPNRRYELGERILQIDRQLKTIAKDGDAINPHCAATPEKLQAAIAAHEQKLGSTFCEVLGEGLRTHKNSKRPRPRSGG